MDIQAMLSAITTVGFPIVCCGAMMWYVKYTTDKNRDEVARLNDQHAKEMSEVILAINNNALALQKLCDRLDESDDERR